MALNFPIAADAASALTAPRAERGRADAETVAAGPVALVSEWLRPTPEELAVLRTALEAGAAGGFVQVYEDPNGRPMFSVTFWRPQPAQAGRSAPRDETPRAAGRGSHRRSLLFRRRRSQKRTPAKPSFDPRQLDLFAGPGPRAPGRGSEGGETFGLDEVPGSRD
ncbi:MAG: hypothetical protein R3C52_10995 [Hyphomonadaceae bacterium]